MSRLHRKFYGAAACLLFVFSAAMGFLLNEVYEGNYNLPESEVRAAVIQAQKPRQFCCEQQHEW